jgi:putative SOS response-associated peptidase YedK
MTTEPNELTVSINHERMPVLLSDPADFETSLSGSTEDAFKFARSSAGEQMRIVQSGSERKDLLKAAPTGWNANSRERSWAPRASRSLRPSR